MALLVPKRVKYMSKTLRFIKDFVISRSFLMYFTTDFEVAGIRKAGL